MAVAKREAEVLPSFVCSLIYLPWVYKVGLETMQIVTTSPWPVLRPQISRDSGMFAPRGGVCVLISVAATWRAARAWIEVAAKTFNVAAVGLVHAIKPFMMFRSAVVAWQFDSHVMSACVPDLFISWEDEFVAAKFNSHRVRVLMPFMRSLVLNLTIDVLENRHSVVDT